MTPLPCHPLTPRHGRSAAYHTPKVNRGWIAGDDPEGVPGIAGAVR